jgi:serine/threonine-protein phosphatase PP1 catalytic subunit
MEKIQEFSTQLLAFDGSDHNATIDNSIILDICKKVLPIIKDQPPLLELKAPMTVCGDIHGQFEDLIRVFKRGTPPSSPYLFLGDYVDRGERSLEVILLLFSLKILHPYHIFLLRGNHESSDLNQDYGFYEECTSRLGDATMWTIINKVFQWMPLAATIENRIFCVHGGLSPSMSSLDEIRNIDRSKYATIPSDGIVCDLTWADPDRGETEWGESDRGCSYTFGPKVVNDFCEKYEFDFVCRAHQVVDFGYEFFCKRKLVTVFTASNYCGDYGNHGSILQVDANLRCSFIILLPNQKENVFDLVEGPKDSQNRPVSPPHTDRAPSPISDHLRSKSPSASSFNSFMPIDNDNDNEI